MCGRGCDREGSRRRGLVILSRGASLIAGRSRRRRAAAPRLNRQFAAHRPSAAI